MVIRETEDSHYFYVMAWTKAGKTNAPKEKKKFNIYADADEYYDKLSSKYGYVEMFEYIGGKRKFLKSTDDSVTESQILMETDSDDIALFERETGLTVSAEQGDKFAITNGMEYPEILSIVSEYNRRNKKQVICWNDDIKDCTFVKFSY